MFQKEQDNMRYTIETFLAEKTVKGAQPRTLQEYNRLLTFLEHHAGKPLAELAKEDLVALTQWIREHYTGGGITTAILYLKGFLHWAGHRDLSWLTTPRMPARVQKDDLLTRDDFQAILDATKNPMYRALIALYADSAMRRGEAVSLRIGDVEIRPNGVVVVYVRHGKGDQFRVIPIRDCVPYLNQWLQVHPQRENPRAWLFPSQQSQENHFGPGSTYTMIRRQAAKAGIEKRVYVHLMRHSRLTDLVHREKDTRRVRQISGHRTAAAIEIYSHYNAQDGIDVIYPELAQHQEALPILPRPENPLPDPSLSELVKQAVEVLLPEMLTRLQEKKGGP